MLLVYLVYLAILVKAVILALPVFQVLACQVTAVHQVFLGCLDYLGYLVFLDFQVQE